MTYKIARTEEEIDNQLNLAAGAAESGTNLPGMSYEEGVQNAILWLSGDFDDPPIDAPAVGSKSFVQTLTDSIRSEVTTSSRVK